MPKTISSLPSAPVWLHVSVTDQLDFGTENVATEVRRQHAFICTRIDKYFSWLMLVQWVAAIATALWISPLSWAGDISYLHPHVSLALFYGGVLTLVPVTLTRIAPGERITRITIAIAQVLMSSLLIHLTGGRIETHFHIFGSLAFLAFYMDWQVLFAASLTIAIDHFLRGMFLPFSIFGTYTVQPWRWLEHTGWVLFCDVFLVIACLHRMRNFRTLTARHIERGELLHKAYYDDLTGLPNRTSLSRKLGEAINEALLANSGFACLYLDLDRFKEVNDLFGHSDGDVLIHLVAERMRAGLGAKAFLARTGGDEFVALIATPERPSTHGDSAPDPEASARAILRLLREPFEFDGNQITIGASIGISVFPRDGQQAAEILTKSERAMFHAKRAGRNDVFVFASTLFAQARDRDRAERELGFAISRHQLQVHYQPIFHAQPVNGIAIAGLEALVRWVHPTRGNIPPCDFIPLAEETGLIVQLGSFVLHEACRQATEWRARGLLSGRIAVNVSTLELSREDYAESVILTLRQHYTPADAVELEVTESALVHDFSLAERHLRQLRAFGIRISIDDFGTGYSSLGRLRQLTLDTLKIDRSFVDSVVDSEPDQTVIRHIIAMAHTLHMRVIAEGVETASQHALLCSLGCDELQGFLLARPLNQQLTEEILVQSSSQLTEPLVGHS